MKNLLIGSLIAFAMVAFTGCTDSAEMPAKCQSGKCQGDKAKTKKCGGAKATAKCQSAK